MGFLGGEFLIYIDIFLSLKTTYYSNAHFIICIERATMNNKCCCCCFGFWFLPPSNHLGESMHTPSPSLSFLKILWNFSIKLLSLHEIISIIMRSWFKFPLITVKPGQALAQRVHQWIDYLKIESVSHCMRNEQWISGYYFQYLGRIFTAHYACRNIYRDGSEIYDYKQIQLSNNNLKIYWNLRQWGGRFAWPGLTITSM